MENKEKMLSRENEIEDESASRYKELFEYEMTQIRRMLEDEFGALSSEDMNNAGMVDESKPVNIALKQNDILPAKEGMNVAVIETKKLFDDNEGVAEVAGVSVSLEMDKSKTLSYEIKEDRAPLSLKTSVKSPSNYDMSLSGQLDVDEMSVVLPKSLDLKPDISAPDINVRCNIDKEIKPCASVKPTELNVEINTQLDVENKNIECNISSADSCIVIEFPSDKSKLPIVDVSAPDVIGMEVVKAPCFQLGRAEAKNDIEVTELSVMSVFSKTLDVAVDCAPNETNNIQLPTVKKLNGVTESSVSKEVNFENFAVESLSSLKMEDPKKIEVEVKLEDAEVSLVTALKLAKVKELNVQVQSEEIRSISGVAQASVSEIAVGSLKVDVVDSSVVSNLTVTPEELNTEISLEVPQVKSTKYQSENVVIGKMNVKMKNNIEKRSAFEIASPEAKDMPSAKIESKKVVCAAADIQVELKGAVPEAYSTLVYDGGDASVSLSTSLPEVKAMPYTAVPEVKAKIEQKPISFEMQLNTSEMECNVQASSVKIPDENDAKETIKKVDSIVSQIKVPHGLTYDEICERYSDEFDSEKILLSIDDILNSLKTDNDSE